MFAPADAVIGYPHITAVDSRIDYSPSMRRSVGFVVLSGLFAAGCSHTQTPVDSSLDAPGVPGNPGEPGVGAHALVYYKLDQDEAARAITTPALTTQATGSTIIVSVGRGDNTQFALPTDSKSNAPYLQLDTMHPYTRWQTSGTAAYAFPSARGGSDHRVSTIRVMSSTDRADEITMAVVEVTGGTRIQDAKWNEVVSGPLTSRDVTTTGPATLVAFWWGDGFPGTPQSATANNGFVVIDSNAQETHSFVQCVVAVKNVATAGTYNVTWTPTPEQGAQLWLVAVQ